MAFFVHLCHLYTSRRPEALGRLFALSAAAAISREEPVATQASQHECVRWPISQGGDAEYRHDAAARSRSRPRRGAVVRDLSDGGVVPFRECRARTTPFPRVGHRPSATALRGVLWVAKGSIPLHDLRHLGPWARSRGLSGRERPSVDIHVDRRCCAPAVTAHRRVEEVATRRGVGREGGASARVPSGADVLEAERRAACRFRFVGVDGPDAMIRHAEQRPRRTEPYPHPRAAWC